MGKGYFIVLFVIFCCTITFGQGYNPETGQWGYVSKKYISILTGYSSGDFNLKAESAFSNPQNSSERLWSAEVSDVSISPNIPQLILKFGGWKGWKGAEMELSFIGHKIPSQIVYYDSHGQIFVPPTSEYPDGYYYPVEPQDSVDLSSGFLKFNLFSVGGSVYGNFHLSSKIKPYFGLGFSLGLNNITSKYPGPGSYAAKNVMAAFGYDIKDAESLNTTDFGASLHIPIGIKSLINEKIFFSTEFRFSKNFLSFGSSDAYLKERDKGTLDSFQLNFGIGTFIE